MSSEPGSYRRILKSTAIMGGATFVSIVIGLVRTKLFALLLGPAGVGLLGLFQSLVQAAASASQLGLNVAGVVLLAERSAAPDQARHARSALWLATGVAALVGGLLVWTFREPLAQWVTGSEYHGDSVGWLGVGVALTVVAGSFLAVLQAHRRIGDLARVTIWGAFVSAVVGVVLVYLFGTQGIVAALIAVPAGTLIIAALFVHDLALVQWRSLEMRQMVPLWRALIQTGAVLWATAVAGAAAQAAARAIIARQAGLEAAGLFQAAGGVSATNLTLLLAAMAADYYPRMSVAAGDPAEATNLARQQLEVALLLAAPLLIGVSCAAPLVLNLLYSAEFMGAANLLQWQVLGDILRLAGWTFGIVLVSRGDGKSYLVGEVGFAVIYVALILMLLPALGIEAAGIAYVAAYAAHASYFTLVCWRSHGIGGASGPYVFLAAALGVLALLLIVGSWSRQAALLVGVCAMVPVTLYSVHRLSYLASLGTASNFLSKIRGIIR